MVKRVRHLNHIICSVIVLASKMNVNMCNHTRSQQHRKVVRDLRVNVHLYTCSKKKSKNSLKVVSL